MQYGKKTIETTTYVEGIATTRTTYEQRIKITTDEEELKEYLNYHRTVKPNDRLGFRYEHPAGKDYYYIIKAWVDHT